MARYPRHHPPTENDSTLVEVTARVIQGRALLRPSSILKRRVYGVVGRAQELYEPKIHAFKFLSTHYHGLFSFTDLEQQRNFMQHIQGNLAREVGRLHDWQGSFWGRRYRGIPVSDEDAVQAARIRYVLEQGCKENLVASPLEWPGPDTTWYLTNGVRRIQGEWIDRTAMYHARRTRSGAAATEADFAKDVEIELSPLPCWDHLAPEEYRELVHEMVEDIEIETRHRQRLQRIRPLGTRKIEARHPHSRPTTLDRSPAPAYHCGSKKKRKAFWRGLREFVNAYRDAADALRNGDLTVDFPPNCFPPPRQFVPTPRARAPGTASTD